MSGLDQLVNKSLNHSVAEFLKLLSSLDELLKEGEGGAYLRRSKGLVKVSSSCEAIIVGDIHGDLESLRNILSREGIPKSLRDDDKLLVFLGDYVDRGKYSLEVLYLLFSLKLTFPDKVLLLRGNHEPPPGLIPYPHDLPIQCRLKYGERGEEVYDRLMGLFQNLPHSAVSENGIFLVHGGIPISSPSLREIDTCGSELLEELLWNDPSDLISKWAPSPRGAGYLFGESITKRFLSSNGLQLIIRGHEPCDGFKLNHKGRVITVFSRKGAPYYNAKACYLRLKLEGEVNLEALRRSIVLF